MPPGFPQPNRNLPHTSEYKREYTDSMQGFGKCTFGDGEVCAWISSEMSGGVHIVKFAETKAWSRGGGLSLPHPSTYSWEKLARVWLV